jgi:hypothetical protein
MANLFDCRCHSVFRDECKCFCFAKQVPGVLDVFLPFAMALMEFMLFAVLTQPLTNEASPRSIIAAWFGCFGLFSLLAVLIITHVRRQFQRTSYEPALQKSVADVILYMHQDRRGAGLCSLIGIAGAVVFGSVHAVSLNMSYILAAIIVTGFVNGFISHSKQRRALESGLANRVATKIHDVDRPHHPRPAAQQVSGLDPEPPGAWFNRERGVD